MKGVNVADIIFRDDLSFALISGPCVVESEQTMLEIAEKLKSITDDLGVPFIFKASFDKANRSSGSSYRGPGMDAGLKILQDIRDNLEVPIITDIHEPQQAAVVSHVVDAIQIPALLCRQTDLIAAAAETGKPTLIKKGQFLSPNDMGNVVDKFTSSGNRSLILCERGSSFGYNNVVVDMRSLEIMRKMDYPVVFDAGHSVQIPGGLGTSSGGFREFIPVLSRAAIGAGVSGIFLETHPRPNKALSDGPNSWPLSKMEELLKTLKRLDQVVKDELFE